jgi:RNA 3'-terminal phosphate cyclase (ATP)
VLQTILPALLVAPGPSTVTIEGGTHNPWAPTFDFLDRVYLPLVRRMGPGVTATLERYGFFPAGGGRFSVSVEPRGGLSGIDLLERGDVIARRVRALVSNLPERIGEREVRRVLERLSWDRGCGQTDTVEAHGPGNVVEVEIEATGLTERFTAFGRTGTSAERVADDLADQLLLPLGISAWLPEGSGKARGGAFRTGPLSRHSTTHIEILRQFLGVRIEVAPEPDGRTCLVSVSPPR